MNFVGCNINELKLHLQGTAIKNGYAGFDISDYSGKEFHIDHIRPCASFDLTDPKQQKQCFHWSNLQILSASENMVKSDNIAA